MNEQGEKNTAFRRIAFQFAGTVSLVAALLIIVPLITVYFLTQSFDNKIRSEINHTSNYVQRTVLAFIDGAYNLSYELSVNPSILSMETDIQTPVIKDTTDRNEYLELIFIQDMSGMQTARSAGELAYRGDRWWFNEVKNKRMPFISQSYYSIFTHTPCASIFLPLFDDSEMVGVFGVDIKLEYIQNLVEHFAEHDTGRYSFVMDGEGVVLAHPDSAYIETLVNYKNLTRTLLVLDGDGVAIRDELDNFVTVEEQFNVSDGFKSVINSVMSGNSGTYTIDAGYTTYYVSYEPINMPGYSDSWSVITLRDRTVAMEVVTNLVTGILIVLTMAFVVFIIFAMFLYRSLRKTMINLESSRQEAEEANISKSNFLAMMSHEIRTPMNAIIGIAQIELSKETMPDTYVSAFGKILASGNSLLGIINDIRAVEHCAYRVKADRILLGG
jgi:methyl-accepting chemotaxis protein